MYRIETNIIFGSSNPGRLRFVGMIMDIKRVTLNDVCDRGSSNLAQKDILELEGEYPVYGASGYIKDVDFYHQEKEYVAVVKDGAGIGRTMHLPAKSSIIGTLQYLLPKENIQPKYLYYAVTSMKLSRYYTGATIPHIYFKDYKKESLPLPTEDEQSEIVEVLEKIEKIIGNRKKQLEEYDTLIKSRFVEMFGDTVLNDKGWDKANLSEFISFLTSGSRGWSNYFSDSGEMFLTIKNVKNNCISIENVQYVEAPNTKEADRTRVKEGDLLISITADLERTGVITKAIEEHGAYINQHLSLIRLQMDKVNPIYLSHFLESPSGQIQFSVKNQNGVKAGLNFDAIKSLQILVPPIQLQNEYIRFIKHIDKLKFELQESLN